MDQIDYSNTSTELETWFGLSDPSFLIVMIAMYLVFVLKIGPNYIKNRSPYKLKTFMTIYNVAQVITCVYVVRQCIYVGSFNVIYFWKCATYEQNSRSEYIGNRLTYLVFWQKLIEFSETVVFVLRKKQNQVSFLHVFHHCATVSLVFLLSHFSKGGTGMYPLFLNSNVHIVMYSYYLVAALSNQNIGKHLLPIKKSITTLQMIQFVLILLQVVSLLVHCTISKAVVLYYCFVVFVIFYGFYDFYKKSYIKAELKA